MWTEDNPSPYFKETPSLLKQWRSKAQLPEGVSVRVGRWDIPGRPVVVLVKFDGMYAMKDEFYGNMWEQYGVDSLHAYGDYDEGCAFAHAAGVVIESICRHNGLDSKNYIAHFDEWTTGMGLLYLKWRLPQVATIFTTHATSIGRSICGNNKPLYGYLSGYDGDQMARELNMEAKHSLEKAAALQADCFTTVSRITAIECGQLLGRQPDVVTPNGFEQNFVPATKTKLALAREAARRRILDVVSALTGQSMDDDTFIVATSGRNEYRNKGIDLFLDAVNRLGEIDPQRRVLALILVPAWVKEARADLKEAMSAPYRNALNEPIITHWLNNQDSDSIICRIRSLGFENGSASRVMAVYVPCYLNGGDGVVDMSYYDVIPGLDATVFPSYYEPWGYTPLESVAFGVPTVTTTLSGFGQWILSQYENGFESCGVMVIDRGDFNYDQVKEDIAVSLRGLTEEGAKALSGIQRAAMSTAKDASWTNFIKYYYESFDVALGNAAKRMPKNAAAKKRNQRKQK